MCSWDLSILYSPWACAYISSKFLLPMLHIINHHCSKQDCKTWLLWLMPNKFKPSINSWCNTTCLYWFSGVIAIYAVEVVVWLYAFRWEVVPHHWEVVARQGNCNTPAWRAVVVVHHILTTEAPWPEVWKCYIKGASAKYGFKSSPKPPKWLCMYNSVLHIRTSSAYIYKHTDASQPLHAIYSL